uniref:Probable acetate kinase n=1 Tax=Melanopsichium pennsylvanicum 4 TaxID=1398559 RepID=A0A077R3A2_9BASI|nr:related to Acetate kinase [Melanopsichium pennsylvanicum 4]
MENIIHVEKGSGQGQSRRQGKMLCLNAGSSSLKFKLFDATCSLQGLTPIVSGSVKLKSNQANVELNHRDGKSHSETKDWTDIASGEILSFLLTHIFKLLDSNDNLDVRTVVHRVVHGAHLDQCVSITRSDQHHLKTLQFLAEFAPLHNAVSVQLIKACLNSEDLPEEHENVCCFDTAFHSSLDGVRSRYMVDPCLAGETLPGGMELRKWGFHGLSYNSILNTLSSELGKERSMLNVIICHLGSGSSMCGVVKGKSFDTTMGLTPLEGLPGATRSGSVDPVLPLHISAAQLGKEGEATDPFSTVEVADGIRVSHAELVLNKNSGFKSVAGTSDFQQVTQRRTEFLRGKALNKVKDEETDLYRDATLAFDIFVDRIVGYMGNYMIKMSSRGGVHAVVFSGGIGEASSELHTELAKQLNSSSLSPASENVMKGKGENCWQLKRDELGLRGTNQTLASGQNVPWFVCKTDEEGEMAKQVFVASTGQ